MEASDAATHEEPQAKRARKVVTLFNVTAEVSKHKEVATPAGRGVALGASESFVAALDKYRGDDEMVKNLHNLCYGHPGRKIEAKKNIRAFNGFSSSTEKESKLAKVLESFKRWTVPVLKETLGLFGLKKSGNREQLVSTLIDFLASPTAGVQSSKRKASSAADKKASKKAKGPKRALTGFLMFGQANRASIKAVNPQADFGEMGRLTGEAWSSLLPADQAKWNAKSAAATKALREEAAAAAAAGEADEVEEEEEEEEEEQEEPEEEEEEEDAEKEGEEEEKEAAAPAGEEEEEDA